MNGSALISYLAPYALYVAVLAVPSGMLPRPVAYILAAGLSVAALVAGWKTYLPLRGTGRLSASLAAGVALGLLGTLLWVALKAPFYTSGGEAWAPAAFWARLVASSTVVPVFEELLFRGLVLLGAVQWADARREGSPDPLGVVLNERAVTELPLGRSTPMAAVISSVAFAAGHAPGEWVAAFAYGLLMVAGWALRKDLVTCITAHATTNAVLALWVRSSGNWNLW